MGTLELLQKELIWKNIHDKWCFPCKKCGNIKEYKNIQSATVGFRKNNGCVKCMVTEDYRMKSGINSTGIALRGRKKPPLPDYIKEKIRQTHLNRNKCIEYANTIDDGANEWFEMVNSCGYYFVQNGQFPPMSYRVDGYDPYYHIVVEYDTPHHRHYLRKDRDINKQDDIIRYWEGKGKPLLRFVRVIIDRRGKIDVKIVYRSKIARNIPLVKNIPLFK